MKQVPVHDNPKSLKQVVTASLAAKGVSVTGPWMSGWQAKKKILLNGHDSIRAEYRS